MNDLTPFRGKKKFLMMSDVNWNIHDWAEAWIFLMMCDCEGLTLNFDYKEEEIEKWITTFNENANSGFKYFIRLYIYFLCFFTRETAVLV